MKKLFLLLMLAFMTNIAVGQTTYKITKIATSEKTALVDGEMTVKDGTIVTKYGSKPEKTFKLKVREEKRRYAIFVDPNLPRESSPKKYMVLHKKPKDKQKRLELYKNPSTKPYLIVYLEKK